MTPPQIEVRTDRRGGFEVAISSPGGAVDELLTPSHHPDHGAAIYAARLVSEATGWRVLDRFDAATGVDPLDQQLKVA